MNEEQKQMMEKDIQSVEPQPIEQSIEQPIEPQSIERPTEQPMEQPTGQSIGQQAMEQQTIKQWIYDLFEQYTKKWIQHEPPAIQYTAEGYRVIRVTEFLTCPLMEPFNFQKRTAKISDGVFLDEDLKNYFEEHGFKADYELKRAIDIVNENGEKETIVIVGHPDVIHLEKGIILDIKHTQTVFTQYPNEEIVEDIEISERYIDQVKIYKWLLGKPEAPGFLLGRVGAQFYDRTVDRWFLVEVIGGYTDEDIRALASRYPRYPYECKYCKKRTKCPYSQYIPDEKFKIKQQLGAISKTLGYKTKIYKGWEKYFKNGEGMIYSDGYLWKIEKVGTLEEILKRLENLDE